MAAKRAPQFWRQDVYQDAFVKFLRYPPLTFGGAFLMAKHAMFSLMRRERYRLHTELVDVIEEVDAPDNLLAELRRICPAETEALLLYYGTDHHTGAERIHAMRQRRIIKRKVKERRGVS
jgi:DNA-directed RNA polymerase specialized sigma24 family protein